MEGLALQGAGVPDLVNSGQSSGFPVRTKVYQQILHGVPTNFSFSLYMDQMVIFASQLGTAGTVISATQDAAFDGSTTFTTTILLGKRDEPLLSLCARRIVELASAAGYRKPMIIGMALKEHTPEMVKAVEEAIKADSLWSSP
mmetsp:Transcript_14549/g.31680  ORF Transcript_14549/g.31680 Transcript_14549/m.31680 type:complete len:143 (+) Transcript_14549:43-471(+)